MASLDYATYLLGALLFTLALRWKFKLGSGSKPAALALLASLVVFGAWDALAASAEHWSFGLEHTTGILLLGMPLEEWAFFLVIPYLYLTLYQIATRSAARTTRKTK